MVKFYTLMHGNESLGILTPYDFDFPWVYCHFAPTLTFAEIKPVFDKEERLLLAEEEARQAGEEVSDEWEAAYDIIEALGLRLVGDEGTVATQMLLHIDQGDAWFRA